MEIREAISELQKRLELSEYACNLWEEEVANTGNPIGARELNDKIKERDAYILAISFLSKIQDVGMPEEERL